MHFSWTRSSQGDQIKCDDWIKEWASCSITHRPNSLESGVKSPGATADSDHRCGKGSEQPIRRPSPCLQGLAPAGKGIDYNKGPRTMERIYSKGARSLTPQL